MKISFLLVFFSLVSLVALNAISLSPKSNLGVTSDELKKIQEQKILASRIRSQILFWDNEVNRKTDYRDAYLQLSLLSWRIGRNFDAEKFYEKASLLDPNYKGTGQLKKLISN